MNNGYVLESLNGAAYEQHITMEMQDSTCIDDGTDVEITQYVHWNICETLHQLDNGDVILNHCPNSFIKGLVVDGFVPDRFHNDEPVYFLKSPDNKKYCLMRFDSIKGKAVCKYLTLTHDQYYSLFLHYCYAAD